MRESVAPNSVSGLHSRRSGKQMGIRECPLPTHDRRSVACRLPTQNGQALASRLRPIPAVEKPLNANQSLTDLRLPHMGRF